MNWYKHALEINNFQDRNLINHKMRFFEDALIHLEKLSKLVFQNAKLAKQVNFSLLSDKKMSSHPSIRKLLVAADEVALDNPWKFSAFCKEAIGHIESRLDELEQERYDWSHKKESTSVKKGLQDDYR